MKGKVYYFFKNLLALAVFIHIYLYSLGQYFRMAMLSPSPSFNLPPSLPPSNEQRSGRDGVEEDGVMVVIRHYEVQLAITIDVT